MESVLIYYYTRLSLLCSAYVCILFTRCDQTQLSTYYSMLGYHFYIYVYSETSERVIKLLEKRGLLERDKWGRQRDDNRLRR